MTNKKKKKPLTNGDIKKALNVGVQERTDLGITLFDFLSTEQKDKINKIFKRRNNGKA